MVKILGVCIGTTDYKKRCEMLEAQLKKLEEIAPTCEVEDIAERVLFKYNIVTEDVKSLINKTDEQKIEIANLRTEVDELRKVRERLGDIVKALKDESERTESDKAILTCNYEDMKKVIKEKLAVIKQNENKIGRLELELMESNSRVDMLVEENHELYGSIAELKEKADKYDVWREKERVRHKEYRAKKSQR